MFFLEEDDCPELFITQTPKAEDNNCGESEENQEKVEQNKFLGVRVNDFRSPCASVLDVEPHYSDISDDDTMDFETIEPSQIR